MFLRPLIAWQFGRPSGLAGLLMRRTLNKVNARVNAIALDRLELRPTDRVLDVGFGGGLMLRQVLDRLPAGSAAGVEVSEPMLRLARRTFRHEIDAGRLEVKPGSASAIPYADATFDKASAVNTVHFWPEPAAGLREVRRVLKPGGVLVVALRPRDYLERIRFTKYGFTAFEEHELRGLLEAAGFHAIRIERGDDADMGMIVAVASRPPE
jgi:ubiquinone/menaquinone biosynthesis C-methylase UbiE